MEQRLTSVYDQKTNGCRGARDPWQGRPGTKVDALMQIVRFHNPDEENGFLSIWYPSAFECGGARFSSLEQSMMYQKAICFSDERTAARILETDEPAQIKELRREVAPYDDHVWSGDRQIAVHEGRLPKFPKRRPPATSCLPSETRRWRSAPCATGCGALGCRWLTRAASTWLAGRAEPARLFPFDGQGQAFGATREVGQSCGC